MTPLAQIIQPTATNDTTKVNVNEPLVSSSKLFKVFNNAKGDACRTCT